MLFSVVDDRSGVAYQEYRCVYGEEAEAALRFLFNAMAAKPEAELPFQGIPATLYMDNGPVSRAKVFQSVMGSLGVRVLTHMPPSEEERRTPARSKGKSLPRRRPGSSGRFGRSRRRTRPCTTSTSRPTRRRQTCGSGASWSPTTTAGTVRRSIAASRTG
jgi:hypothetical protein